MAPCPPSALHDVAVVVSPPMGMTSRYFRWDGTGPAVGKTSERQIRKTSDAVLARTRTQPRIIDARKALFMAPPPACRDHRQDAEVASSKHDCWRTDYTIFKDTRGGAQTDKMW